MEIIIFTDGGCRGNHEDENLGAWAYSLEYQGRRKEDSGCVENTTNNKQELLAVIKALTALKSTQIPIIIHTDSAYVLNGITKWIKGWKRNNWKNSKKKEVLNKLYWMELDRLVSLQDKIEFVKVKGHSDNLGNERVDLLVNISMDEYKGEF